MLLGIAVAFWFIDSLSDSALMIALTGVVISIAASAGLFIGANGLASLLPGSAASEGCGPGSSWARRCCSSS